MSDVAKYTVLITILCGLFVSNIFFGSVAIDYSTILNTLFGSVDPNSVEYIIVNHSRLPQALTSLFSGAALAISGLMLQTLFSNPLAAPSILGVSSGSGLGVAVVMLLFGGSIGSFGLYGYLSVVFGAMAGAMAVLILLVLFSSKVKSNTMLLVIGMMVGYVATSLITLLSYYSEKDGVVSYVVWGMGDFTSVNGDNLIYFISFIIVGLVVALILTKPLNALLLGEKYAANLGINIPATRIYILLSTGLLTAIVTAFCGPVAFIGLSVPHITRLIFATSNHRVLVPMTIIIGSIVSLLCSLLTVVVVPGEIVPLNAITPLMGAPVIIYVIINKKRIAYFN